MPKLRYFIALLLLLSSCVADNGGGAGGQSGASGYLAGPPAVALASALEEMRLGEGASGARKLLQVRERHKGTTWAARASFVLGMRELKSGGNLAVQYLQEALALGEIRPYVLLYLARAYYADKELRLAEGTYRALLGEYPGFAYEGQAIYERAVVLEETGSEIKAGIALNDYINRYPDGAMAGEALIRLARLGVGSGDYAGAMEEIKTLLVNYPGKAPARQARALLKENRRLKSLTLTTEESCVRATRLFSSYFYSKTVSALKGLVTEDMGACGGKAEPLLVETLFRLKRYDEAEVILKERLGRLRGGHNKNSFNERSTLLLLATVYLREDKTKGFLESVRALSTRFPESSEARRALLMEGGYYEGEGRWGKAIGIYGRILKAGAEAAPEAVWRRGWLEYRMGRYLEAYKTLGLSTKSLSAGKRRKFAYWRGRALEKAGLKARAMEEYPRACDSRMPGYYCYMAQRRLGPSDRAPGGVGSVWEEGVETGPVIMDGGFEESGLRTAMVLLSTGLTSEAADEADKALKAGDPNRNIVFNLMSAFYIAGDYYHAIKIYDSYFGLLTRPDEALSPALLKVAFPIKLVEYISAKGLAGEADPLLVAAVMREESSYDPDTISRTGAVGLMQVMPSTAKFIAQASGSGAGEDYDLSDPDTNIRMGAWYLAYLWQKTGGSPALTIAGYNAGLNSVRRWRKRYPLEDDEFIESIPFSETRNYTKKVLKSYEAFQMLAAGRRPLLAYGLGAKALSE